MFKTRRFLRLAATLCFLALACAWASPALASQATTSTPPEAPSSAEASPASPPQPPLDPAEVLARARPAVVTVIGLDENGEENTLGSGLIVAADGVVLTAWHVVAGQPQVRVNLSTGAYFRVEGLLGWDKERDFALLKVSGKDLPTVPLGDSDKLRQGDRVLTLGAPLGLEQTASEGIVSAVRELPAGGKLLQITAAISPGSSGGPVLNERGEVVGIACFLLTKGQSLNFAVPINDVKPKLRARAKTTPLREAAPHEFAGSAEALCQAGLRALPQDEAAPDARQKFEQALVLFRQALTKRTDYGEAHFYVGYCIGQLGHCREAAEAFKQAIRLKPDSAPAHYNLGWAYGKVGRWQESLEAYKQAIRIKPDYAEAHCGLGWAYGKVGRWQESLEAFKQAIRIKPDYAKAHFNLGTAYETMGHHQEALQAYKQAIRIKPDYAEAHCNLGLAHARLGGWQQSLEALKLAIRIRPDLAQAHHNLGWAYGKVGRWQESLEAYKQAIRLKPDDAEAHYNLGWTYLVLGDRGRALDEYKILMELDPDLADKLFKLLYP